MTTYLRGKRSIKRLSYKPEEVREMEKAGIEIYPIQQAGIGDPDLEKWRNYYEKKNWPVFGVKGQFKGRKDAVLWIKRTVGENGKVIL